MHTASSIQSRYLVQTTASRIVAYRRYRENAVGYFRGDKLERLHWEYLYEQASELRCMPRKKASLKSQAYQSVLQTIRIGLASKLDVSEESIELQVLKVVYTYNLNDARILSLYPKLAL